MQSQIEAIAREMHRVWCESRWGKLNGRTFESESSESQQAWQHLAAWHFSVVCQAKHENKPFDINDIVCPHCNTKTTQFTCYECGHTWE